MKLQTAYPATTVEALKDHPTEWKFEWKEITDTIQWIEPFKWGDIIGNRVYFSDGGTGNYWLFVTSNIIF